MQPIYSVDLQLPKDMLPTDFEQMVLAISDTSITSLDRDGTLLFVSSQADADAVEAFAHSYKVDCEQGKWVRLDKSWSLNSRNFTDYGLITLSDNRYLDLLLASIVCLIPGTAADAEFASAAEQADEHAIALHIQNDGRRLIAIDRHQVALIEGIARAYRCSSETVLEAAD
ncbi:hypothetical protein [Paenibacillus sp. CF384]|uniref:hypothetical protein n=1 Tax=Paenibacillus sp. CF384 TaxID=1884382 RepID=UPI00089B0FCE|nr:hypothetical protein [Paenibacillus sp. CF384]SDW87467.1 hypothetical protein SAMN05518855_1006107 [Paenibacillus sp. CF384]